MNHHTEPPQLLKVYTALGSDQSDNQRGIYDVNQFTATLTNLLHLHKVIYSQQEKNNANKPFCEETLEDGGDPAGYLCGNADATLGSDDLGLKYWPSILVPLYLSIKSNSSEK